MRRFEASTLEEAYSIAAKEFSCSITELEIQVVQRGSKGFFGLGKKPAVIVALRKKEILIEDGKKNNLNSKNITKKSQKEFQKDEKLSKKNEETPSNIEGETLDKKDMENNRVLNIAKKEKGLSKLDNEIFDNFHNEKIDIQVAVVEVEREINLLFSSACFKLDKIIVYALDNDTIQIEINGDDAALLIGKEGYRYKALAYLLYNWVNSKYGYKIRLEIAEFLHNQEEMIENYLKHVIERVENEGRAQTKVLDGVLVQIALQKLRQRYPEKYVAVRTNRDGGRYVIVNEFMERR